MKKNYALLFVLLLVVVLNMSAQVDKVTYLITGPMNVAPGGYNGVALYVPDAMRVLGENVVISHNGTTELGGNFYHDATTNVFDLNEKTTAVPFPSTPSTGIFRFIAPHTAPIRYITTQSVDLNSFNRGQYYIAFPNIQIATTDSIILPATMGIDAKSLTRTVADQGFMILRSDPISGKSVDASLRITNPGASADLVTLGAVVVERDMSIYREGVPGDLLGGNTNPVFAFATPYKDTQYSGYYAGNWVRTPSKDADGHVRYVLANQPSAANSALIDRSQYVIDPLITLKAAAPYLIQPRPANFDYQQLKDENGLMITGQGNPIVEAYKKQKFYFNGKVYQLDAYKEQLFADDILSKQTLSASRETTVNWLIGNSYTAPLSTTQIARAMKGSGLTFAPYIYVFPAGSTGYQPLPITDNISLDAITVGTYDEIPAMSIFMVRVSKSNTGTGSFDINKGMQVHSNIAHNVGAAYPPAPSPAPMQRAAAAEGQSEYGENITNQVTFRLSPEAAPGVYDLAAIGLREKASLGSDDYDIPKVYASDFSYQLFTLSNADTKLSVNGVPKTVDNVVMAVRPPAQKTGFVLTAQHLESLTGKEVLLEDLLTGSKTNLSKTNNYLFFSNPGDVENRFIVHFSDKKGNGDDDLSALFQGDNLIVNDLTKEDIGNAINVYNAQGQLVLRREIDAAPLITPARIIQGVYVIQMTGKRTASVKAIKR